MILKQLTTYYLEDPVILKIEISNFNQIYHLIILFQMRNNIKEPSYKTKFGRKL